MYVSTVCTLTKSRSTYILSEIEEKYELKKQIMKLHTTSKSDIK